MANYDYIIEVVKNTTCTDPSIIKEILAEQYSIDAEIAEIKTVMDLEVEDIYLQRYHNRQL